MMNVNRMTTNIASQNFAEADRFYHDILGLEVVMDQGWIRTYATNQTANVQISIASEGGSDTPVPDISIEVDDLDEALRRVSDAGINIEYGPQSEPWGVRRFFVFDPSDKLVNIMQHETAA
jgi:catechol 2,3-dioxygenase-like lactoylglutathione lyase family enzyme